MLTLTACDFFLHGEDLKKELDQQIAYTNAPSVSVYLKADAELGEFLSDGEKTFKVGYDTEVQFTVNQDSYVFEKLEAVVRNSPETSRSESVQFTEVESDAKKGIYKINVKVLKQVNDIMIRPVCTLLPKISSISPALEANGCNQDSTITIAFNKNMNPESFKNSNGTITGLSITNGDDEDLTAYFDEPYFASDNKTLIILPLCYADNPKFLLPPDESKTSLNIKVNYTFVDIKDEDGLGFTANGTHNYKINKNFNEQEEVTVLVQNPDPSYGSFLSAGEKSCIVGFGFEVEFTLNTESYIFEKLEAVSKNDTSLSRADCVQFTLNSSDADVKKGIYKIKIRVLKETGDLLIRPVCTLLPKINSITPSFGSTGCDQDSIISISFNKPVNTDTFFDESGNVPCVSITSDAEFLDEYFNTPYFSDDKKTLYFAPLCIADLNKLLLDLYDTRSFRDITVSLVFNGEKDCDGIALTENLEQRYRINKNFSNQKKVSLNISGDTTTGSFLSSGEKECTVGFYVEVQYTVNKDDYYLVGLEAVSSSDGSSRASAVSITQTGKVEDEGIYKYKIRVTEEVNDILIKAVCLPYPAVDSYLPSSSEAVYSNTPITVTFNMPMEALSATPQSSVCNFDNISLKINGTSVSQYFEEPTFNADKTSLKITPKVKAFTDYVKSLNVATVQVNVAFSDDIYVMNGNAKLPLIINENARFAVKYFPYSESTPPLVLDWFGTTQEITPQTDTNTSSLRKFSLKTVDSADFAKIDALKNLCEDDVYFYFRCYDKDSGVQIIEVNQKYTNDYDGKSLLTNSTSYREKTDTYDLDLLSENVEFVSDGEGNTIVCIRHKIFESDEPLYGAIFLQATVYDACGNYTELEPFSVIAHGNIEQCFKNDYDTNYFPMISKSYFEPVTLLINLEKDYFDMRFYKDGFLSISYKDENLKYYCKYTDKNGTEQNVPFESESIDDANYLAVELNLGEKTILEGTNLEVIKGFAGKSFKILAKYTEEGEEFTLCEQEYTFPDGHADFVHSNYDGDCIDYSENQQNFKYDESENSLIEKAVYQYNYKVYWRGDIPLSDAYNCYCVRQIPVYKEQETLYRVDTGAPADVISTIRYCIYGEIQGPFTKTSFNELTQNLPASPVITQENLSYNKSKTEGFIDVIIDFGEDISEKYDSVTINSLKVYSGRFITIQLNLKAFYPHYDGYTRPDLYRTITILAEKNGVQLPAVSLEARLLTEQEKIDYDNITPLNYYQNNLETTDNGYILNFWDYESGPGGGEVSINGNIYQYHESSTAYTYKTDEIPFSYLNPFSSNPYTSDIYDKAGNHYKKDGNLGSAASIDTKVLSKVEKSTSGWTPKFIEGYCAGSNRTYLKALYYGTANDIGFYRFISNAWESSPVRKVTKNEMTYSSNSTGANFTITEGTNLTISGSYFVKLATKRDKNIYGYKIYYTGSYSGDGSCNLLYANGSAKDSMVVSSDAPVFVHTIVTKYQYDECKNWNAEQWECLTQELNTALNPKQFAFSDGHPKRYDIPMSDIESGSCYVVVAHYADDTVLMSEVMQK